VFVYLIAALVGCDRRTPPVEPDGERGALALSVSGLPAGTDAVVQVTGPSGFVRTVTGTELLVGLRPGRYQVRANNVRAGGFTFAGTPPVLDTLIQAGQSVAHDVHFDVVTGALAVTIRGLPGGAPAAVRITGGGTSTRLATSSVVFSDLPPGSYVVSADSVVAGGTLFRAFPPAQVTVNASTTAATLEVIYDNPMGTLTLVPNGLPPGLTATARLQGPLLVDRIVSSGALTSLPSGTYTLTLPPVTNGTRVYAPATRTLARTVSPGARDSMFVEYTEITTPINLTIDNVIVTQAVQRADNGVPLVAGRDALLRAFVRADRRTTLTPPVRVRLFDGNTVIGILPLTPPDSGVPTLPLEGALGTTYSTRLAGDIVRNGVRIVIDVDPDSTLGEVQRNDNVWPAGGTPRALNVTTLPPFTVRFVPVLLDGFTGDVSTGTFARLFSTARQLWPLAQVGGEVRAPFTSSAPSLLPTDVNGAWSILLNELKALRAADGAPAGLYYYGVVHPAYDVGTTGLGLVGSPTAVGWDRTDADIVAAHEWGHNFGRLHAPCGNPITPDQAFPFVGGFTGSVGWNAGTNTLMPATTADIMGYCNPAWVSEYNYSRALTFRQSAPFVTPAVLASAHTASASAAASPVNGLLVWGRIVHGRAILEPSVTVHAPATLVSGLPTHEIIVRDSTGRVRQRWPIVADAVDHYAATESQFAAVVPLDEDLATALDAVELRELRSARILVSRRAARTRGTTASTDAAVASRALPSGRVRFAWNQRRWPMAVVFDDTDGRILAFARDTLTAIVTRGRRVRVVLSDGVRSVERPIGR
jgi:hypothetical protein